MNSSIIDSEVLSEILKSPPDKDFTSSLISRISRSAFLRDSYVISIAYIFSIGVMVSNAELRPTGAGLSRQVAP